MGSSRFFKKVIRNQAGFTLVEMVVVLVILVFIFLIGSGGLIGWRPNFELRGVNDDLVADMQKAKMHAIKNNVNVTFTFTTGCPGGGYTFQDSNGDVVANRTMAKNMCLVSSTFPAGAGFSARGMAINPPGVGNVVLRHNKLQDSGDPQYTINQNVAGGLQSNRGTVP